MMRTDYIFQIRGTLPADVQEQAVFIAAAVPEGFSRKAYPTLWKLIDYINARPKANQHTIERRRKIWTAMGLFDLLLGLFAVGPAIIAPDELMLLLIISVVCLCAGIVTLWKRHRVLLAVPLILTGLFYGITGLGSIGEFHRLLFFGVILLAVAVAALLPRGNRARKKFQKDGHELFDARNRISPNDCLNICFTDQGVKICYNQEESEYMPYSDFLCIVESQDLILLVIEKKGLLLAKSELTEGMFSDFKETMSGKVCWIVAKNEI